MFYLKEQEETIFKELKRIKRDSCPNIFISGKSVSAMETLTLKMVEVLKNQQQMDFKGIYEYFTIHMPYYESKEEAISFVNRLLENISIAKDGYSSYCGFILVEISETWGTKGYNTTLDYFLNLIRNHQKEIRFIILCPDKKESTEIEHLFAQFVRSGPCIHIHLKTPTIQQYVSIFTGMAREKGYGVSKEVEKSLYQSLLDREDIYMDDEELLSSLLNQVIFDKTFKRDTSHYISLQDIQTYLSISNRKTKTIGFVHNVK